MASLVSHAEELIAEVSGRGGMIKAIEAGIPKQHIEEAAARKQARLDRGEDVIVGVNKYSLENEDPIEILDVDNARVREQQIKRLEAVKKARDENACRLALGALTAAAASGKGNLLELAVEAAKVRATVGEISFALEKIYGRYRADIHTISGVYGAAFGRDGGLKPVRDKVETFASGEGRRPRLLVAKMGQDGHDRGAKVIATAFKDMGFDVDVGPLFATPAEVAQQAIENDVHIVGVSSHAAGHKTLVPQLIDQLKKAGREDILVVCGGVIPAQDYAFLLQAGVAEIFGPGTHIPDAAGKLLALLDRQHNYRKAQRKV
jgi:methylmalonyl-CoA mutase